MNRVFLAVGLVLVIAGCNNRHEAVLNRRATTMNDLATALKSIQDAAPADAAAPQISAIAQQLGSQRKEIEGLPKLSDEDEKKLEAKHEKATRDIARTIAAEAMRIHTIRTLMTPKLRAALEQLNGAY